MTQEKYFLKIKVFFSVGIGGKPVEYSATSASSQNKLGKFDILSQHINFITLIFDDIIILTAEGEEVKYQFQKGVLEVNKNIVNVFLGI